MDTRRRFADNLSQCWRCKRRTGEDVGFQSHGKETVKILYPICDVTGLAMTHVYNKPCPYFNRRRN